MPRVKQAPALVDLIPRHSGSCPSIQLPRTVRRGRTALRSRSGCLRNKDEQVQRAAARSSGIPEVHIAGATSNDARWASHRLSLERLAKNRSTRHWQPLSSRGVEGFIGAADLYVTPYLNEAQITSGTLAYAFGAGKAVISTPYWHAAELLADDRGVLVPFRDSDAVSRAVLGLLRDDTRRHALRKNAYKLGREMVWSSAARLYWRSFEQARLERAVLSRKSFATKTLAQQPRDLPEMKLEHLSRMTDSTGMFQHAILTVPNFSEGYRTDDNARAFILAVLLDELGGE
jgi:hypothetical protein